jgi:hypothetical protein
LNSTVSISSYDYGHDFNVSPNPNKGQFIIKTKTRDVFELIDVTGSVINVYKFFEAGEFIVSENLASGLYFIKSRKNGEVLKLVVE